MMKVVEHIDLANFSTMRLGGKARYMVDARSKHGIAEAVAWAKKRKLPILVIGSGSNVVFRDEGFKGLVILNQVPGLDLELSSDGGVLTAGSGEVWDHVVAKAVDAGLYGIECLSLVPGTAGAAPIQNIGAYGQELSNSLIEVEAYDIRAGEWLVIPVEECHFGYRSSRFNGVDKGRFIIANIKLRLFNKPSNKPLYKDLNNYFVQSNIEHPNVVQIREAVINIRNKKLPDPLHIANTGSFFGNPIISKSEFDRLISEHPDLNEPREGWSQTPFWELPDGRYKVAAGRLIQDAGFHDYHDSETGMATWPTQSLVLVNKGAKSTDDLLKFKHKIVTAVQEKFGITLEQEPELI